MGKKRYQAEQLPVKNISILDSLQSRAPENQLTVNDFNDFVPGDLTPEQQNIFQQQAQMEKDPSTGPLDLQDYYPGINQPVAVGSYSGKTIGATTLFAPMAGITPAGMIDAREAAIQKAAMNKMREIEDFIKAYQAPTTKHSTVQKELDKVYFEGLNQWVYNAKKKFGSNWTKALESDVNFQKWNKSAQTAAQQEDYILNRFAKIQDDIKTGKFVATPELTQAMKEFDSGIKGLGESPFNKAGHKFNESWARLNAEHDFANVAQEYLKSAVKRKLATAGVDESNPDYYRMMESTSEQYTDETLREIAVDMKKTHYSDSPISEDELYGRLKNIAGAVQKTANVSISQKREGGSGADYQYNNNDFSDEPESINTTIKGAAGAADRKGEIVATDGITFKKPIEVVVPIGKKVFFTKEGLVPTEKIGNKTVQLGKMAIVDVLNMPGSPLDGTPVTKDQIDLGVLVSKDETGKEQRIKFGKGQTKKESVVVGKYQEGSGESKEEIPFIIPTKHVENALVRQWKDGKVVKGVPVDESYRRAEQYNASNREKKYKASNGVLYTESQLRSAGYTDDDLKTMQSE